MPRQIVTPYKPSEDIEQTPLLPSTPTSPDSLQTASGYFAENNHTFLNAHSAQTNDGFNSSFDFPNQTSSTPVTAAASNAGFTSSNPFVNLDNSTHNKILSEGGGFTNILEEENFSKVKRKQHFTMHKHTHMHCIHICAHSKMAMGYSVTQSGCILMRIF